MLHTACQLFIAERPREVLPGRTRVGGTKHAVARHDHDAALRVQTDRSAEPRPAALRLRLDAPLQIQQQDQVSPPSVDRTATTVDVCSSGLSLPPQCTGLRWKTTARFARHRRNRPAEVVIRAE